MISVPESWRSLTTRSRIRDRRRLHWIESAAQHRIVRFLRIPTAEVDLTSIGSNGVVLPSCDSRIRGWRKASRKVERALA